MNLYFIKDYFIMVWMRFKVRKQNSIEMREFCSGQIELVLDLIC